MTNHWLSILGNTEKSPEERERDAARQRAYRRRHKAKLRANEKLRNTKRREYFKQRDQQRKEYFALYHKEVRRDD